MERDIILSTKNPSSRASQLADQIRLRIQSGGLIEGDFFMTEAQVAQEYGASRTIVREAVSRLCGLGILEGRQRKGLVVRRPCLIQLLSRSLPSLAGSQEDLAELLKLRRVIEIGAIDLAVANATEKQIDELSELADQYELAVRNEEGNDREAEVELSFHALILQMTGSTLIAGIQQVLGQFFEIASRDISQSNSARKPVIWQHHELVAAIRDRDVESARIMIRAHLRHS